MGVNQGNRAQDLDCFYSQRIQLINQRAVVLAISEDMKELWACNSCKCRSHTLNMWSVRSTPIPGNSRESAMIKTPWRRNRRRKYVFCVPASPPPPRYCHYEIVSRKGRPQCIQIFHENNYNIFPQFCPWSTAAIPALSTCAMWNEGEIHWWQDWTYFQCHSTISIQST